MSWEREYAPIHENPNPIKAHMATLYFNLGKKEKISRGDILGFLMANTSVGADAIGKIVVKDHTDIVAVRREDASEMLKKLDGCKIKNKKVRVSLLK